MTLRAILVDLGGTLVDYFGHTTPGLVLPRSLTLAGQLLLSVGIRVLLWPCSKPDGAAMHRAPTIRKYAPRDPPVLHVRGRRQIPIFCLPFAARSWPSLRSS